MSSSTELTSLAFNQQVDAVKAELRSAIAAWVDRHPGRIVLRIPFAHLDRLQRVPVSDYHKTLDALQNYTGAALQHNDNVHIPWPYKLHVLMVPRSVEVLLLTDKPIRGLADELTALALEQSKAVDVDALFEFIPPLSVIESIDRMSKAHRTILSQTLNRRLFRVGLSIQGGSILTSLQIRRNR